MAKDVRIINPITQVESCISERKIKVCAYCRVSSDSSEQLESFSAQVKYYSELIKQKENWEFAGIYADEGITGTRRDKRDEFLRLIRDCETERIDMIITKSITRFARNTVESIATIRALKEKNIAVYFEKENINTLSQESEFMLTILSSMAQEESISISQNARWGYRKRFKNGTYKPSVLPYGYIKDKEDQIVVNVEEAKVVKEIYSKYLNGMGTYRIAKEINKLKIKPRKSTKWSCSTINDIIKNEKYIGNLLMQKTYMTNEFPFIRKRNKGQMERFLIEDNHEALISKESAVIVKNILEYRKRKMKMKENAKKYNNTYELTGKLVCLECGGKLKRQIRKSKQTQYIQWGCQTHIENIKKCKMKSIGEEKIRKAFTQLWSKLKINYEPILVSIVETLNIVGANDEREKILNEYEKKIVEIAEQSQIVNRLRSKGYIDSVVFIERQNVLSRQLQEVTEKKKSLSYKNYFQQEIDKTNQIIKILCKSSEEIFSKYNLQIVKEIQIESDSKILFELINGLILIENL